MGSLCTAVMVLLSVAVVSAQSTFHGIYGGVGFDQLYSVLECENGDFVAAGGTRRFTGSHDLWLMRTDSAGKLLWERAYGSIYPEFDGRVAHRPGGGFYLVGQTYAPWNDTISLVVYALDGDGNILWERLYGDYYNAPADILSFADGRVAITGTQIDSSQVNLGQMFLLVLDSMGNVLIHKDYGGPMYDAGLAFCPSGTGGYVIAGIYDNRHILNDPYSIRFYIVMVDEHGNTLWTKKWIHPIRPDYGGVPRDIVRVGSNHYVAVGDMSICFDDSGGVKWIYSTFGGNCILPKTKHSFLIAYHTGFIEVDEQGHVTSLGSYPDFMPSDMIGTADGGWLLCGDQEVKSNGFEGVLIKTNCEGGPGTDPRCLPPQLPPQAFPKEVSLAPGADGQGLAIQVTGLADSEAWGFRLVDMAGRLLAEEEGILGSAHEISMGSLASAAYVFEWKMNGRVLKRLKFLHVR